MPVRKLVWILLVASACAQAAPPSKKKAPPPAAVPVAAADIDVDAMARAKDVGAQPATASDTAAAPAAAPTGMDATLSSAAAVAPPADAEAQAAGTVSSAQAASPPANAAPAPKATKPGEADRRLVAGCEAHATNLLDAAQKGDYATATRDFDSTMRTAMPPEKFRQAWESLGQFGKLQARGQSHLSELQGYIAVTIPLLFEKKNLYAQVACGQNGRVAGFHIKPLEAANP